MVTTRTRESRIEEEYGQDLRYSNAQPFSSRDTGRSSLRDESLLFRKSDLVDVDDTATENRAKITPADRFFTPFCRDEVATTYNDDGSRSVFIPPYEAKRAKNEFKYFTGAVIEREPQRKTDRVKQKDSAISPSKETFLVYKGRKETEKENKTLFDFRSKLMIAVYLSVVVLLIAMIITSSVTANALRKDVSALENGIRFSTVVNDGLSDELLLLNNDAVIMDKAKEIGMVEGGESVVYIALVPEVEEVKYEKRTNWFDKLCDWLSGVFGG